MKNDPSKVIEKRANGKVRVATINEEPSRTQQQFRDQVNVNSIMAKYKKTGLIDHVRDNPGTYSDMTQIGSYQDALQKVINAQQTFETLPSNLRQKFGHDPQQLITFLSDDKNYDEAVQLGLVIQKEQPQTPAAPSKKTKTPEPPQE